LKELPNTLIVHLQRIVFNLDTLQNEKMSNRVEFPFNLSLLAYTREGLEAAESGNERKIENSLTYEYKLKGVVVHKGTAQYGHYYSYINYKQDKWLEFNDSIIKDFDVKKLASEAYGGKESEESNDYWSKGDTSSTNAYMLVYEKI
jgi:ubiquitin C-terminal hydrolase